MKQSPRGGRERWAPWCEERLGPYQEEDRKGVHTGKRGWGGRLEAEPVFLHDGLNFLSGIRGVIPWIRESKEWGWVKKRCLALLKVQLRQGHEHVGIQVFRPKPGFPISSQKLGLQQTRATCGRGPTSRGRSRRGCWLMVWVCSQTDWVHSGLYTFQQVPLPLWAYQENGLNVFHITGKALSLELDIWNVSSKVSYMRVQMLRGLSCVGVGRGPRQDGKVKEGGNDGQGSENYGLRPNSTHCLSL